MSGFRWSGQTVPRLPDWRCYRTRISTLRNIIVFYHAICMKRDAYNEQYEKMGIMPDLWRKNPFAAIRDNRAEGFSFVLPKLQTGNVDNGSTF